MIFFSDQIRKAFSYFTLSVACIFLLGCGDKESTTEIETETTIDITLATYKAIYSEDSDDIELLLWLNSNDTSTAVTLTKTLEGTATETEDYTLTLDTASFRSLSDTIAVIISLVDDTEAEEDETIELALTFEKRESSETYYVNLTIEDNDGYCAQTHYTQQVNISCDLQPDAGITSLYTETISGDERLITSNNYPNHAFAEANHSVQEQTLSLTVDATPSLATEVTSILQTTNQPKYSFGIALNGVLLSPSPATPFIFEDISDPDNVEYNWNWVFEPTNNIGAGSDWVSLDCNSAHTNGQGEYHYHGKMYAYADTLLDGLGSGTTVPTEPVQIGWAADGYPIVYLYGPDESGSIVELTASYKLKDGYRPGDGIHAPCGEYNGKYTNDYEYEEGLGDLDECNGIERSITLTTAQGSETFNYFYVITNDFPVVSRCFAGTPNASFD